MQKSLKSLTFIAIACCLALFPDGDARAVDRPAIPIAAIFSQTGQAAASNHSVLSGVRIAVDEVNSNGGVLGRPVELLIFDNQSTPIGSSIAGLALRKASMNAHLPALLKATSLLSTG